LRTSSPGLTHGEVFRYMERGLNAEQIASIRDTTDVYYVKDVMSSLNHLFDDTLPTSRSAARTNSQVYKELLNHHLSPALLSYVNTRLHRLRRSTPRSTWTRCAPAPIGTL